MEITDRDQILESRFSDRTWLKSRCVEIEFIASAMRSARNKKGKLDVASCDYERKTQQRSFGRSVGLNVEWPI